MFLPHSKQVPLYRDRHVKLDVLTDYRQGMELVCVLKITNMAKGRNSKDMFFQMLENTQS
jgi:hypothetical protein